MSTRIPPEERLTNLVVALMATEVGLSKQQILDSVSGYRQRLEKGAASAALDKMFERDKDELRSLGIPVETLGDHADPNDLREARYRIPKAEYDLPLDIDFTPAELAVLRLAGSVWSDSSLSSEAQAGLRKIRALGIDVDEPIIGFAPQITAREPSFAPLQDAIERGAVVAFDYLKPGEQQPQQRSLMPLALVEYEARWHIFGIDTHVNAERTFLLTRIVSEVRSTGERFASELRDGAGERALEGLLEVAQTHSSLLEITPGTEAALRLSRRAVPAQQGIRVPYVDVHIFADELASYGPEVRVVEPLELRSAVIARLRAVLEAHEADSGEHSHEQS